MINSFLHEVYVSAIPIAIIAMLALLIVWSVLGERFYKRMRLLGAIVAVVSVAVILYATLFSRSAKARGYDFIPFSSFQRAVETPEMYRSMLMNVFLFMPLGMALPFVFRGSTEKRILLTIAAGFALSVTVEALQGLFSLGMAETDDVIINTLGTVVGSCAYLLSLLWMKMSDKRRKKDKSDK